MEPSPALSAGVHTCPVTASNSAGYLTATTPATVTWMAEIIVPEDCQVERETLARLWLLSAFCTLPPGVV
jgi:hypothetical protein